LAGADDAGSSIDPTHLLLGIYLLRKAFLKILQRDSPRVVDEILMTFPVLRDGWINNACLYIKAGGAFTSLILILN
jgi:hypothetical protein